MNMVKQRNIPLWWKLKLAPSPFDSESYLLKIGLQGRGSSQDTRPAANLVFLIDVSGSMSSANKLPLLVESFKMLQTTLQERDRISLVVYAGAAGVVLEGAPGTSERRITRALDRLQAGGSTAGGQGIELAYSIAEKHFIEDGINRVILASDGDFNVGMTDHRELIELIEAKRENGVALTVLGFGSGNLNDRMMEQIANHGNGNYYYIDTEREADKVLVQQMLSTIETIASDVKIQVEFNPALVKSFRLLGYENRRLEHEDFDNDAIDAGEIGAGHTVTAIYEIQFMDWESDGSSRYSEQAEQLQEFIQSQVDELGEQILEEVAYIKLRYKNPGEDVSVLLDQTVMRETSGDRPQSEDFYFAASVAYFAQILKENPFVKDLELTEVIQVARQNQGPDPYGFRSEFIEIMETARSIQ
jgi:Ca-activated chloride channel family protein